MDNGFFERPTLNSPYAYPARHWELDAQGQPTGEIIEARRTAQFITPIPRPRKHKRSAGQERLVFDEGAGVSTATQEYDPTPVINELRHRVNQRGIGNPSAWGVTPETARLFQHWPHHEFTGVRPFFCQIEAEETAIWLTEVAPNERQGKGSLEHLANANHDANPELIRLAFKLATDAGYDDLKGDERKEAERNTETARLWISGREVVNRKLGLARMIDLYPTPFFHGASILQPAPPPSFSLVPPNSCLAAWRS